MNQPLTKSLLNLSRIAALASLTVSLLCQTSSSQTITNASFEANSFSVAPGYISDNTEITGWTADVPSGAGLSPTAGDTTFADNGTIPNGTNVAFIAGGTTLSTTITGLTAGKVYKVTLQANAATDLEPILRVTVDSVDILALNIYSVGTTAPYEYIAFEFTAASDSALLGLVNDADVDQTLLVDNLTIAESSGKWHVDAWTDDSTSGVDNQFFYTHAYHFGTTSGATINGVSFIGVGGGIPAVSNKFSTANFGNIINPDVNNITGGSAALANAFIYWGSVALSGDYENLTIKGLTPGTEYVATVYSCGWDGPTTALRWATFNVGGDRLTVNQDQFDNDNGIRFSYRYTAGTNGTAALNVSPIALASIHFYGFSNREAVSRNVAPEITVQPQSSIVSQGSPVDFVANANGIPAPSYQWRFKGTNIAGATTNIYSIAAAGSQNVGGYDVIASNSMGSVTSIVAHLTVGLPLANASFEVDSFDTFPGYSSDNAPITGWTQSDLAHSGLNPISDGRSPFADNGTIPNGKQVAFLQTGNPAGATDTLTETLSQTVTGLTVGSQYYLHYYENSRGGGGANLEAALGSTIVVPKHRVPSGSYQEIFTDILTAPSNSLDLTFTASGPFGTDGTDTTALIDNVAIVPLGSDTAPFVIQNPTANVHFVGDSVTFSSRVIGSSPLSYQWLKNGAPITDATNTTFSLVNIQTNAAADYSLRTTNSAGSVTTTVATLTVYPAVPGLFNTGIDSNRVALADGEIDPHFELIVNPDVEDSVSAIVEDSTVFPISDGTWLRDTANSKWIGPRVNTSPSAVGLYTYRTIINLTNLDPKSVVILGQWSADNAGRDIQVNGVTTGNPQNSGFNAYTPFAIYGTNTAFTAGTNYIDFIVENVQAAGYTGLRMEILQSDVRPAGSNPGTGPTLQITANGNSLSISWAATAAGQKLQSAPEVDGPWNEVPGATNPYPTTPAGTRTFFRVVQEQ